MDFSEEHPKSIDWFLKFRQETTAFTKTIVDAKNEGKTHILVNAPVKSGKKEIVEILKQLTNGTVIYITSFNRKDVINQKKELNKYGINVHITDRDHHCQLAISDIKSHSGIVYLCIDECDYGSGNLQKLSTVFSEIMHLYNVIKVYFSATSHELESSSLSEKDSYQYLKYIPSSEYNGAKYFLENDLVIDVEPFFYLTSKDTVELSDHSEKVINESITPDKHIGVVRVANSKIFMSYFKDPKIKNEIQNKLKSFMPKSRDWEIVPIDSDTPHEWENRNTCNRYTYCNKLNYLFIIKQTCTRGTDLKGWHHRIAFWHDSRTHKSRSTPNTLIQAFLRPSHYGLPQKIRLYVDKMVIQLAADNDMQHWISEHGKAPTRTKIRKISDKTSELSYKTIDNAIQQSISMGLIAKILNLNYETMTFQYAGENRKIELEKITRESDIRWGTSFDKKEATIMPVLSNSESGNVRYIINYKFMEGDLPICATLKSMYEISINK
jgi:adenosyl cobinamide kinase/adenosyl cobinamide phosphate guanylyltransferase